MEQLTREEAIAMAESQWWVGKSDREIVEFQLYQQKLCMPWSEFHAAMEGALGRSVWTHEFADSEKLRAEYEGRIASPTFEEGLIALESKLAEQGKSRTHLR